MLIKKIPDTNGLVATTVSKINITAVENEIPNYGKYILTPEFNKLTAQKFSARLKHANVVAKTDFVNKLTKFNREITSDKTKH